MLQALASPTAGGGAFAEEAWLDPPNTPRANCAASSDEDACMDAFEVDAALQSEASALLAKGKGRGKGRGRGRGRGKGKGKGKTAAAPPEAAPMPAAPPEAPMWEQRDHETYVPTQHPFIGPDAAQRAGPAKEIRWDDHPSKSFSLFITESDWQQITKNSNSYVHMKGAGADDYYKDMQPFSVAEIKAGHGILVDNGIAPAPRVQYKFQDPLQSPWGSARIKRAWPKGHKRWQAFRSFLHISNPLKEGESKLRKIEPLHSKIRDRCETCVEPGQKMAFDEATCGFQGRDSDTLQHKDKAEGQGWQADMCGTHGYPWTWYWRHEKVPIVLPGFSVLWQRCFWMFRRLKMRYPLNDWYIMHADNLFISTAIAPPIPELPHVYINGTARTNYSNFPACTTLR